MKVFLYFFVVLGVNMIDFCTLLYFMPNVSVIAFLITILVIPVVYNVILLKQTNINDYLKLVIIVSVTTFSFVLFSLYEIKSGNMETFAAINSVSTDGLVVDIDTNLCSFSNVLFIIIEQLSVMFILIWRGRKNDRSKETVKNV